MIRAEKGQARGGSGSPGADRSGLHSPLPSSLTEQWALVGKGMHVFVF